MSFRLYSGRSADKIFFSQFVQQCGMCFVIQAVFPGTGILANIKLLFGSSTLPSRALSSSLR